MKVDWEREKVQCQVLREEIEENLKIPTDDGKEIESILPDGDNRGRDMRIDQYMTTDRKKRLFATDLRKYLIDAINAKSVTIEDLGILSRVCSRMEKCHVGNEAGP